VPDPQASPNGFVPDFFNASTPGRARGAVFSTPGTGFQVSAGVSNPTATPIGFGNLNPTYPGLLTTFSSPRLFSAIGSNVVDVTFVVPGSTTAAGVSGFGAVFTDVDLADTTSLMLFDVAGNLLDTRYASAFGGDETLSFLGVQYTGGERIARVRITAGNAALGPSQAGGVDVVAMDDFIYGEPIAAAAAEPATLPLAATALAALAALGRRRQHTR